MPDPEVEAKPKRRSFTAEYKRRILREADAAKARGELGALLRREGLYSSALTAWRKERDNATQAAFSRPRGPKPQHNPLAAEMEKLRRRNQRLEEELRKAQIVIEVQKKVARPVAPHRLRDPEQGPMILAAVNDLAPLVGRRQACQALAVPRATWYRRRHPPQRRLRLRPHPRALSQQERGQVLACLHEERFQDCPPAQVYAALLDQGHYHCSIRTMYRLLDAHGESRERRDQLTHPPYQKPELLATGPNQLWSWDITKLRGAAKWTFFYLYVILDVFSRHAVGWMIAYRESSTLAQRLIEHSCRSQHIQPGQLTVHADRGSSMKSKPVALLMADLGVLKTHSRPHVSNDNPFSESQFRTLKYRPDFPDRFGSIEHARAFCQPFFRWYNHEHHHSGLGLLTPAAVHYGQAPQILAQRQIVLTRAFTTHPERFVRRAPRPPDLPTQVWINPPKQEVKTL
ncbi:MAG: IS3 family transposase [Terriglobia bacterium]